MAAPSPVGRRPKLTLSSYKYTDTQIATVHFSVILLVSFGRNIIKYKIALLSWVSAFDTMRLHNKPSSAWSQPNNLEGLGGGERFQKKYVLRAG